MAKAADIEKRIKEWQQIIKEVGPDALEETAKETTYKPKVLAQASELFGLNLQKPGQLKFLCIILADILFSREKVGRKPESLGWHPIELYQLALADKKIRTEHPGISDTQVAEILKEKLGPEALRHLPAAETAAEMLKEKLSPNALRHRLPSAKAVRNLVPKAREYFAQFREKE